MRERLANNIVTLFLRRNEVITLPAGRPTKYKPEYNEQAYKLCLLGMIDEELAKYFEVEASTLNNWKSEHPEFMESLKNGREVADAKVTQSLYHRARGYSHPEDKIFLHEGEPVIVPTIKHYPPDATSMIFWLKNRQRGKWRDKVDHELTGKDGGPIQVQTLTDAELDAQIAELYAKVGGSE